MTFRQTLKVGSLSALLAAAVFAVPGTTRAAAINVLHSFCSDSNCADGSQPIPGLAKDSAGNLFGTTQYAGAGAQCVYAAGCGTVFELVRTDAGLVYQVIYNFCSLNGCKDGNWPQGGLIADTSGNLYGSTERGGAHGDGIVFELSPGTPWKLQKLYDFCHRTACVDGSDPFAALTYSGQASGALYDGTSPLYGSTRDGGANNHGVVFRLSYVAGKPWRKEKVLHHIGAPALDGNSRLIGAAQQGGEISHSSGVIYRFTLSTSKYKVLYTFCSQANCADGDSPFAGVVLDANGDIFGTTLHGGAGANCPYSNGCGVAYRLVNGIIDVMHAFCSLPSCGDGEFPTGGVIYNGAGNVFGTAGRSGAHGDANSGGTVYELSL